MKKDVIKNSVATICFILVFMFVLNQTADFMELKESRERFSEFWAEPEGYDVWLLGNSHMFCGVDPMGLWKEYGIRSYCLASSASRMHQVYWTFMNALDYAEPEVVVLDCYHIHRDEKANRGKLMHVGFDSIPLSPTKVRAVYDLFETTEEREEFLINFSIYHNRWKELEKEDFTPEYTVKKGSRKNSSDIYDNSGYQIVEEGDMQEEETLGYVYVRKIIEECQKRGIALVLTSIPSCESNKSQRGMNGVAKLVDEYGGDLTFLNLSYEESLVLDYQIDFKDRGHVNESGSRKITSWMGEYLSTHYGFLRENLDKEIVREWDDDYLIYKNELIGWLKDETKLKNYLIRLGDEEFSCEIYQSGAIASDIILEKLVDNIQNKTMFSYEEADFIEETEVKGDVAIVVRDAESGKLLDKAIFMSQKKKSGM